MELVYMDGRKEPYTLSSIISDKDIDMTLNSLKEHSRRVLVNRFIVTSKKRLSRSEMCKELELTIPEFDYLLEQSLLEFAGSYRGGVIEKSFKIKDVVK